MASYLISFAYKAMQAIGPCPRYGSHILHLTQPPASQEVAEDLARTVAMVYSLPEYAILNWDVLPDQATHPSPSAPYGYLLGYAQEFDLPDRFSNGIGSIYYARLRPILELADLREVEGWIRQKNRASRVSLTSCKPLAQSSSELRAYFQP